MLSIRDAYDNHSHNLCTGACIMYNKHAVRHHNAIYINLHAVSFLVRARVTLAAAAGRGTIFHRNSTKRRAKIK